MKVVIVGGRHEADYIISMYNNKKNDLIVINQDEDVCRYLSAQNNIPVMRGISTRQSDLHLAGAENADSILITMSFIVPKISLIVETISPSLLVHFLISSKSADKLFIFPICTSSFLQFFDINGLY